MKIGFCLPHETDAMGGDTASGADVMLVTTAPAQGTVMEVAGARLTFFFPTARAPALSVEGNRIVTGRQRVGVEGGNVVFEVVD